MFLLRPRNAFLLQQYLQVVIGRHSLQVWLIAAITHLVHFRLRKFRNVHLLIIMSSAAATLLQGKRINTKESIIDLTSYIDKKIAVHFTGGRLVEGKLIGADPVCNLVLDEAVETTEYG